MAQRRMFSPAIVSSEEFLMMPVSSQALYFHLGMNADDDGFIQPKIVMRTTGANDDDLRVLLGKRFLISFGSGVVVIKHWLIHNLIQKDRYHPTRFQEEKKSLFIKENKAYTESVNKMLPQVRLGKGNTAATPQTSMKKNRMGSYREDSSSDSHEESIDLETGERSKPKERAGVLPAYRELVEWSQDRRGFKFISIPKQYKAFKEAKTFGLMPADLKKRWIEMENDKFISEKGFDWSTVVYSFNRKPR